MLVGNKCDETEARELTTREGEEQAKKWFCHFMETSAKTNHNVKELFQVSGERARGGVWPDDIVVSLRSTLQLDTRNC